MKRPVYNLCLLLARDMFFGQSRSLDLSSVDIGVSDTKGHALQTKPRSTVRQQKPRPVRRKWINVILNVITGKQTETDYHG